MPRPAPALYRVPRADWLAWLGDRSEKDARNAGCVLVSTDAADDPLYVDVFGCANPPGRLLYRQAGPRRYADLPGSIVGRLRPHRWAGE